MLTLVVAGCAEAPANELRGGKKGGGGGTSSDSDPTEPANGVEGAFQYGAAVTLLPFEVRVAKLAKVVGVEPDHTMFHIVTDRRLDLGDHDYASGVNPDLSWTSSKLTTWVKAIKPICASKEMKAKYAALPEELDSLLTAAYGRTIEEDDRAAIDEALGSALDSESAYQVTCLAVLSSLEFVAR